jgi:hypothetical protein
MQLLCCVVHGRLFMHFPVTTERKPGHESQTKRPVRGGTVPKQSISAMDTTLSGTWRMSEACCTAEVQLECAMSPPQSRLICGTLTQNFHRLNGCQMDPTDFSHERTTLALVDCYGLYGCDGELTIQWHDMGLLHRTRHKPCLLHKDALLWL